MDYEKKYKEALDRAKSMYESSDEAELAAYIFPELRESEDERIRKAIVETIKQCPDTFLNPKNRDDMVSYLEKQKEPQYTKRNELFDKCVENCDPEVMKEVSDKVDEMLGKEQKPIQSDDEKEYVRVLKSLISDFIRDNYKTTDITFYQKIYDWLDGRHIEQKPAEWSEEDEKIRGNLMSLLANMRGDRITEETYQKYYPWLKSLRPSWKPSEEQMETLKRASTNEYLSAKQFDILVSLYEQLKRL